MLGCVRHRHDREPMSKPPRPEGEGCMTDEASPEPTTRSEGLRAGPLRWVLLALGVFAAIIVLRLGLGTLFGGTRDQHGYVLLFEMTRRGINPYVASKIIAWPPFWWGLVAFWSSLWELIGALVPGWTRLVSPSIFLKCLYFLFEIALAWTLGSALDRRRRERNDGRRAGARLGIMLAFLWMPATWTITALHGNFDVIPSFFTFAAFLLVMQSETRASRLRKNSGPSEVRGFRDQLRRGNEAVVNHSELSQRRMGATGGVLPQPASARMAALLLGLAIMARTFPILFALPLAVYIWRDFGWRRALEAAALIAAPTIFSFAVLAIVSPEAIERILTYRGVVGGWWGLGGIARLFISDGFANDVVQWNLLAFYPLMLGLAGAVSFGLWHRRLKILDAGLLLVLGMFCLAPTISLQNFYFFLPWAFWFAVDRGDRHAKTLLWLASINLFLIYVVLPDSLINPTWFHQAYGYEAGGIVPRMPSPEWLIDLLQAYADTFKRPALAFGAFNQNVLRMPVWIALWWWFAQVLRSQFRTPTPASVSTDSTPHP